MRELEAGDIQAGDEQEEERRSHRHAGIAGGEVTGDPFPQRLDPGAQFAVAGRKLGGHALGDALQFSARRLQGHPGFKRATGFK